MGLYPRGWEQVMVELPMQAVVHQHQLSIHTCIGISEYIINSLQICIFNKFALLWGEAQKKIAYCYPKVT